MCLFWKAEKIALKNSVKNCGGVLSRTFSLSKAQVHKTQRSYLSSKRMTGWIQFYAEEDAKMMMMFQKRGKNVPKIDLTDKSWFSCVFSDQSFLYEKPLVFCLFVCLSLGRPTGLPHIRLWMSLRDLVLEHGEAYCVTGRPAVSSRCCLITSSAFPHPIRFYQVDRTEN